MVSIPLLAVGFRRWLLSLLIILALLPDVNAYFLSRFRRPSRARVSSFQELILSRRTINNFEPNLPPQWEQALDQAVEAAISAPNHKLTEPWRFHLLGSKAIENVCQLNADSVAESKGRKAGDKKLERWLAMPGWLVVTCVKSESSSMDEDPMGVAREDYAACCCAVQNLCLSLHANEIGTKWTTGAVNFHDDFHKAAGLSKDEYVVGTIWFGKAAGKYPNKSKKKKGLERVLVKHQ